MVVSPKDMNYLGIWLSKKKYVIFAALETEDNYKYVINNNENNYKMCMVAIGDNDDGLNLLWR